MPMACVQEATNGMNKHVSTSIKTYSDVIPCALKQQKGANHSVSTIRARTLWDAHTISHVAENGVNTHISTTKGEWPPHQTVASRINAGCSPGLSCAAGVSFTPVVLGVLFAY